MRTTINLPGDLLARLKQAAVTRGTTVTALLEDAARAALAKSAQPPKRRGIKLPTYRGSGLLPGVDLDDSADLLERMESGGAAS